MTGSESLLSVIIPVYNAEASIETCVKSILRQKDMPLEIILVNDGSTDRSGILCDLLAEKNECVISLHEENSGITKARLAGAQISRGSRLTFVDADDWIAEDAYKDILTENDCDIVITGICRYIDTEHQIMEMPYIKEGVYDKREIIENIVPQMLWNPGLGTWALDPSLCTKIFKRELILEQLERASNVGSNYGEDSVVIFPIMFRAERIRIVGKIYYFHRQRPSGEIPPYIQEEAFISKLHKVYEYLRQEFQNTPFWDAMKTQLDCFYINGVELKKRCYAYPVLEYAAYFPTERIPMDSAVVLYGAGGLGLQYWEQNSFYHFCRIISWVDTKCKGQKRRDRVIQDPELIRELSFDYVLIAVDNYYTAKEIVHNLIELGVEKERIVWHSVRADRRAFEEENQ